MEQKFIRETNKQFASMTKGLKKVGDSLLSDSSLFAIYPAKKVGELIGVSETTILRFCTMIGYVGYNDFQKDVRNYMLAPNKWAGEKGERDSTFAERMQLDISNLHYTVENLDNELLDNVVDTLINSSKIIVAGYYQSFSYAHWLSFNLSYILHDVVLYRPENDAGMLDMLPKEACIVIFSYYRYALDTIRLAEEAKSKSIKVIAITDSRVSPIAEYADFLLPINISNKTLINKGPVTMSLINTVIIEIIEKVKSRGKIKSTYKFLIKDGEDDE
ncbi:SIS domain-containing protein [Virgibacillus halodenitrificans]|nr:SIS domain-containing protein [Virgibacillus halodenitrificans]